MFITLRHGPDKSITGTDGVENTEVDERFFPKDDEPGGDITPSYPPIAYGDPRRGKHGGLLYNCPPQARIGAVVFAAPGPYREVVVASTSKLGPVLGVLVSKSAPTICEVVQEGPAPVFVDLEPGARYFLTGNGGIVTVPLRPQFLPYIHFVGLALNPSTLLVQASYPLVKTAS